MKGWGLVVSYACPMKLLGVHSQSADSMPGCSQSNDIAFSDHYGLHLPCWALWKYGHGSTFKDVIYS